MSTSCAARYLAQCSNSRVILSSEARTVACDVVCRVLVRSRPFWVKGLSNAWHSRDGVSDELVDAYRLPQLVRGWEIGLVKFIRARVTGKHTSDHINMSYCVPFP